MSESKKMNEFSQKLNEVLQKQSKLPENEFDVTRIIASCFRIAKQENQQGKLSADLEEVLDAKSVTDISHLVLGMCRDHPEIGMAGVTALIVMALRLYDNGYHNGIDLTMNMVLKSMLGGKETLDQALKLQSMTEMQKFFGVKK